MTLAEIAQHVCSIVGTTDDESLAICKDFIRRRYKVVWEKHPWRETMQVVEYIQNVNLGSPLEGEPVNEVILFQADMERVLAIVKNDSELFNPVEWTNLFLSNPNAFSSDAGGPALGFTLRRPSASPVPSDLLDNDYVAVETSGAEDGKTITIEGLTDSGFHYLQTIDYPNNLTPGVAPLGGAAPGHNSSNALSLGVGFREIWSIRCNINTQGAFLALVDGSYGAGSIEPGQLEAPLFPALRLWEPLEEQARLRILGKLRCPGLDLDVSVPFLQNVDEVLIAYAHADMLERQRQYAKAAGKRQEGEAGVLRLIDLSRRQTADGFCIVPWTEGTPVTGSGFTDKTHW